MPDFTPAQSARAYSQAIAAAYAFRGPVHKFAVAGGALEFGWPEENYGANLIRAFSMDVPDIEDLIPDPEQRAGVCSDPIGTQRAAYRLGIGVLTDEFNCEIVMWPATLNTLAKREANPSAVQRLKAANRPTFAPVAAVAVQTLMANPTKRDWLELPRVAVAYRQLDGILSRLYRTTEQLQRVNTPGLGRVTTARAMLELVTDPERR